MQNAMTIHAVPGAGIEKAEEKRETLHRHLLEQRRDVFLLCLGFTGNPADARDLAQETFARALARPAVLPEEAYRPWLLRIARNACIDHERRRRVRRLFMPRLAPDEQDRQTPDNNLDRDRGIARVRAAIRSLSRPLREVLVLREYGELSYREIAAALDLKQGTVMSRLNRARDAVIRMVKEECHEDQQ